MNQKNKPKIRVLIIESDVGASQQVKNELAKWSETFELIDSFSDSIKAIQTIRRRNVDVLFLDINQPFFSGLELLGNSSLQLKQIVFLTSSSNYIHQSIKSGRIELLIKPIIATELRRLLKRLSSSINLSGQSNLSIGLNGQYNREDFRFNKLSLPTQSGYIFIDPKQIIYCEAQQEYTMLKCRDRDVLVSRNLKFFEGVLSSKRFFRIHKSYILNLEYIKSYQKSDGGAVELTDSTILHLGRSKKKDFIELMGL